MLLGLAGLLIPVLVHLLARRKQDRVDWGAMQFLEPSPKQKRSLWIENVWLMLLRMGLIAALAIALARPWWESAWLARLTNSRPQDVALIVDGSASLERLLEQRTVGDDVRRLARQVLAQLDDSDALQIYDARESPLALLPGFIRDRDAAKEALLDLPIPTGSADLPVALTTALRDLLQTGNLEREIVVITDAQARSWRTADAAIWQSLDALRQQARVPPRIWVLTAGSDAAEPGQQLALGAVRLSRELAMPGSTVRISAPVRSYGSPAPSTCEVALEIDGIASPRHVSTVRVPGHGEALVEFEIVLERPGCHAVTMVLKSDAASPGHTRASAIIEVGSGWPVLLVDAQQSADPTQNELFFLHAAFDAGGDGWLRPTWVSVTEMDPQQLSSYAAVILANVATLSEEQVAALESYVMQGGAVLVTLGDQMELTPAESLSPWQSWLPVQLQKLAGDPTVPEAAITINLDSLELPWQERFQRQRTGGLGDVRFSRWWQVQLQPRDATGDPVTWARYANDQPALLAQTRGLGTVAVWTSSIDADWNSFPSKPEYVAWWHEVLFALLEPATRRNVPVGESLVVAGDVHAPPVAGEFFLPIGRRQTGEPWRLGDRSGQRLPTTRWPGLYPFLPQLPETDQAPASTQKLFALGVKDAFAVHSNSEEADATPLTAEERETLSANRPLRFVNSPEELGTAWLGDAGRTELSPLLLYLLLAFLVLEVWMTRRMLHQNGLPEAETP